MEQRKQKPAMTVCWRVNPEALSSFDALCRELKAKGLPLTKQWLFDLAIKNLDEATVREALAGTSGD